MTAHHHPPQSDRVSGHVGQLAAQRLLEALGRIHRWILLLDSRRTVVWRSDGLAELPGLEKLEVGVDARSLLAQLPRPQQILPLRSNLRGRSHLSGTPIELHGVDGRTIPIDVDLARIDGDAGELLLVIASPHEREPAYDFDAELLDALPEALLAVDAGGTVRRANAAALQLLETEAEQVLARPVTTLLAEGTQDLEALATALDGTRPARCRLELCAREGDARTLDVSVEPLSNGMRALLLRDVTERERAQQQLRKANEDLEHSIGALAHDLRSPLVGLLGFSRLLRDDYADVLDDAGRHFVTRIEQAARTMDSLIHDLLELSRIGAPDARATLVDPREVLHQLSAELKPRLEAARIELDASEDFPTRVGCDRSRLYQVFSNLIGNAIEHMGPRAGARIAVRIHERDDGHEIVVADNGRGVDPEQRERIFEIFQSFGTRTDGARGTGMGLAIVRRIAEKHGGRAWVDGEPGGGACFHVTLPRR